MNKELEVECVKLFIGMLKQKTNIWKNYNINIDSSYLEYLDGKNLYGQAMSQKLPVNSFKWVENLLEVNKSLKKTMMKIVIRDIFLK